MNRSVLCFSVLPLVACLAIAIAVAVAARRGARTARPPAPGASTAPRGNVVGFHPAADPGSELEDARACLETVDSSGTSYDFMRGSDGLLYLMNSDEPDPRGWLDVLVDMRAALLAMVPLIAVANDGEIRDVDDARLSKTEFGRLEEFANRKKYSGIHSASSRDVVGGSAVTACGGRGVFMTSRDFYPPKNWRKQNVVYLAHELAHVCMGGPGNKEAHALEFWRVLRVLTVAAIAAGVYDEKWFEWPVEQHRENIGAWLGTEKWWELEKDVLVNQGFRVNDSQLEPGEDFVVPDTGSDLLVPPNSAPPGAPAYDPTDGRDRDNLVRSPCCGGR